MIYPKLPGTVLYTALPVPVFPPSRNLSIEKCLDSALFLRASKNERRYVVVMSHEAYQQPPVRILMVAIVIPGPMVTSRSTRVQLPDGTFNRWYCCRKYWKKIRTFLLAKQATSSESEAEHMLR